MESDENILLRKGRFEIPAAVITEAPEVVMAIMGTVIIVRAEHMFQTEMVVYDAYSPHFDAMDEGTETPLYDVEYDPEQGEITWTRQGVA